MAERGFSKIEFGAESPIAVVYGMDKFWAKHLCEALVERGLNVLGVGEIEKDDLGSLEDEKRFRQINYLMESWAKNIDPVYVFDLKGKEEEIWEWAEKWKARMVVVAEWEEKEDGYKKKEMDWREIRVGMVYGPGMQFNDAKWLGEAFGQAVNNKKIKLPEEGKEGKWSFLYVTDLVELLMGACFFPNVSEEELVAGGKMVDLGRLAKILEDIAKTTEGVEYSLKDMVFKIDPSLMGKEERTSWEAKVEIEEGVRLTLQDFFQRKERGKLPLLLEKESLVFKSSFEEGENKEEPDNKKRVKRNQQVVEVVEEERKKEEKREEDIDWLKKVEERIEKKVEERIEKIKEEMIGQVPVEADKEEEKLAYTKGYDEAKERVYHLSGEKRKKINLKWKKKWRWLGLVLGISFLGLIMVPILTLTDIYWVYKDLLKIEPMVVSKNWVLAEELLEKDGKKITKLESKIEDWELRDWLWGRRLSEVVVLEREALAVGEVGLELIKTGSVLSEGIFQEKTVDWEEGLKQMEAGLEELGERLSMVQARLGGDWGWLPGKWRGETRKIAQKVGEKKGKINSLKESLEVWSYMLGTEGERKDFLVLLQNETEIRPTGGFIGSVGFLSFQEGQLLDFSIRDVYSLDGQLKGHVEPPEELKKYLGEPGWYLRDANWEPDFLKSVSDINWFLKKEIGKEVDGVIGMDLAVAKKIVEVVGKIYMPDYEEEITADNLYEQAELYSENKFFPGSSQKASFLGMLGKVLLEEVKLLGPDKYLRLGEAFLDALLEKELMIGINGESEKAKETKQVLAAMGWDGQLQNVSCGKKENCVAGYLHINEANVGVNKANYFLKRGVEQVIELREDNFVSTLKINYENTARTSAWPAGDYKAYVRVYIPREANLEWVTVDGEKIKKEEVVEKNEGSKKKVGFLLTVPILEKRKVELKYSLGFKKAENDLSFIYYLQKQAGWGDGTTFSLLISLPEGWNPLQVYPEAILVSGRSLTENKLLYSEQIKEDLKIGVELGK